MKNETEQTNSPQESASCSNACYGATDGWTVIDNEFEQWLRTVCFQKPTKEAYDLAKSAWKECASRKYGA